MSSTPDPSMKKGMTTFAVVHRHLQNLDEERIGVSSRLGEAARHARKTLLRVADLAASIEDDEERELAEAEVARREDWTVQLDVAVDALRSF